MGSEYVWKVDVICNISCHIQQATSADWSWLHSSKDGIHWAWLLAAGSDLNPTVIRKETLFLDAFEIRIHSPLVVNKHFFEVKTQLWIGLRTSLRQGDSINQYTEGMLTSGSNAEQHCLVYTVTCIKDLKSILECFYFRLGRVLASKGLEHIGCTPRPCLRVNFIQKSVNVLSNLSVNQVRHSKWGQFVDSPQNYTPHLNWTVCVDRLRKLLSETVPLRKLNQEYIITFAALQVCLTLETSLHLKFATCFWRQMSICSGSKLLE